MSDKQPAHRFLMETRSQHLHREENMRRRRELLERESTKPPVMRFGSISGRSKSVSPAPRAVLPGADVVCKSRSPLSGNSASRSRPQSREPRRCLPFPPGAKPPASSLRRSSLSRSRSYQFGSAVSSRVTSPVPAMHTKESYTAHLLKKRSRSSPQTGFCAKFARVSQTRTKNTSSKERRVPFMCSGSPIKSVGSPCKRSASLTPPLLPFSTHQEEVSWGMGEAFVPTLRAEEKEDAVSLISPFALPSTMNEKQEGLREISAKPVESEETISFHIGEFRMPRTPQRRSNDVVACGSHIQSTVTSAYLDVKEEEEEKEKDVVGKHGHSADVEEVSALSPQPEITTPQCLLRMEISPISPADANTNEKKQKPTELAMTANQDGNGQTPSAVLSIPERLEVSLAVEHEVTARSMLSCYASECSATTIETPEKAEEEREGCQLSFDSDDTPEKEEGGTVSPDTHRMGGCNVSMPQLNVEADALSQRFHDCMSAPLTPVLQLPETYRLLEATRLEMAASSNYQRSSRRLGERRNEEGRSSLVLVSGELPVVYTPSIQEPHTPPPSDMPKRHSPPPIPQLNTSCSQGSATSLPKSMTAPTYSDRSPIPRPVTLRSQIISPLLSTERKMVSSLSQNPAETCGILHPDPTSMTEVFNYKGELNKGGGVGHLQGQQNVKHEVAEALLSPGEGSHPRCGGRKKSMVERLVECCSPEAREEVENLIAAEAPARTPSRPGDSGQLSDVLTDTSSISRRVAERPRKHYYDYTYWETYLREVTTKSAQKERRKAAKKSKKTRASALQVESEAQKEKKSTDVRHELVYDVDSNMSTKTRTAAKTTVTSQESQLDTLGSLLHLQSKSSHRKKANPVCASLKRVISRKNRDRIVRQKRSMARRQNNRRQ